VRSRLVEILYFDDCPNWPTAASAVDRAARELGVAVDIRLERVGSEDEAERLRFLGSPTVRVDGRDVEPGAEERRDFALACRVYRTDEGFAGLPPEGWIRAALVQQRLE
jgi:hypothetical protein